MHHSIDAGVMCEVLLKRLYGGAIGKKLVALFGKRDVLTTVCFFVALHDLGKAHPCFQTPSGAKYRHEVGTCLMIGRLLREKAGWDELSEACQTFSWALRLHHQKGADEGAWLGGAAYEDQQAALFDQMRGIFSPAFDEVQTCENWDAAGVLIWAVCVMSDWLASGQAAFEVLPDEDYLTSARAAAEQAFASAGLACAGTPFPPSRA